MLLNPQCLDLPDFSIGLRGLIDLAVKSPRRNSAPIHFSKSKIIIILDLIPSNQYNKKVKGHHLKLIIIRKYIIL